MMDKVHSSGTAPGAAPAKGKGSSREEVERHGDAFREAMRDGEQPGEKPKNAPQGLEDVPPFSGDALLRAMGGSFSPVEGAVAAAPDTAPEVSALADGLAERILVSADHAEGRGEVRISLKDAVLRDTEIMLRWEGEELIVHLSSGDPSSLRALWAAREGLRDRLEALGRETRVEVRDKGADGGDADAGASGGRSRGLDYLGEERGG
ncbi:MAG: hypothetical protein LBD42_05745 [Desulfovibrio sp.]|jgi:type III secretion system needle length determinant|nr:hypothetical protein [Desulfovibrio sp.]